MDWRYWNLISSIIVSIFILILGFFVYFRDKKHTTHKAFFAMSICIVAWMMSLAISYLPNISKEFYLFWARMTQASGNFLALFAFHFLYFFPKRKIKISWWEIVFVFIPAVILTTFALFTRLVFYDVEFGKGIMGLPADVGGPLYSVVVLWLSITVIIGITFFGLKFRKATGRVKIQMKYVFLGSALFAGFTLTTNQIIPIIGDWGKVQILSSISILGYWGALIFAGFVTYAIVKHRLMDIRLIIFRSIIYSILVFTLGIVYVLVVAYLRSPLQSALGMSPAVMFLLAGALIAFGFPQIKKLLTKITDRWLYKGRYNPDVLLDKVGDITNSILLLEPLLQSLIDLLYKELRVEKIAILTGDKKSSKFKVQSPKLNLKYQELLKLLDKKDIVLYDELPENSRSRNTLRKQDISLLVPLLIESKPIGLLVLGNKKSGDAWSAEDIKFLTLISHQIAIAVKNAQFYSKIVSDKDRIQKLLEERKELDKLKEEFQAIATHEINTPIAASEGYLSMVLEGKAGKLTPCLKSFVSQAFQGTQRTHLLIKNLISAAEIEHGKIAINKVDTDIKRLISEVVYDLKPKAQAKNLKLIFSKSTKSIPRIKADPVLIKEAILNLIYNAIKFTKKGQIEVTVATTKTQKEAKTQRTLLHSSSYEGRAKIQTQTKYSDSDSDSILITVEDTGCGIPKKHLPHIFQKFYQADTSYTREHQGTGLGLYVVKSIINLHNGSIKVQSQPQVGSRFEIWLPIQK